MNRENLFKILPFLIFLLASCGTPSYRTSKLRKAETQVKPFINSWNHYAKKYGQKSNTTPFYFAKIKNPSKTRTIYGICYRVLGTKSKKVILNSKIWKNLAFYEKMLLVFHELGHCELNFRGHSENPEEIMYRNFGEILKYWNKDREKLINNLFKGAKINARTHN